MEGQGPDKLELRNALEHVPEGVTQEDLERARERATELCTELQALVKSVGGSCLVSCGMAKSLETDENVRMSRAYGAMPELQVEMMQLLKTIGSQVEGFQAIFGFVFPSEYENLMNLAAGCWPTDLEPDNVRFFAAETAHYILHVDQLREQEMARRDALPKA